MINFKIKTRIAVFAVIIAFALSIAAAVAASVSGAFGMRSDYAGSSTSKNSYRTEENMKEYGIYPVPHDIKYGSGVLNVTDNVAVSIGSGIDTPTKDHLFDALSLMDVVSGGTGDGDTAVLLGVYGSGDEADLFIRSHAEFDAALFDKTDSYVLYIGGSEIAVVGRDTDAAFYGVTTLAAILEQTEGRSVRQLCVCDYSDSRFRGFIEGYYGVPWTTDERIELMRFGSKFKTNIYIYAPKDDPYHSANWRGLYKGADLEALKEQIKAGNETKTAFTWAIHPFMENGTQMTRVNYATDIQVLLAKFQQIYDAGCRQFMVSADDIMEESRDATLQRDLLNDVQAWLDEKGDCSDLIFVASYYSGGFDGGGAPQDRYYEKLMDGLSEKVTVMWTGENICSRLSDGAYERFDDLTGGRLPFIWMNWPVSDYATSSQLLGAGEVFDVPPAKDGSLPFSGVVVNPMQYAEQNKISVFACADYCWNAGDFDVFKSYEDSMKYIEPAAPEALKNIAEHLTTPANKTSGKPSEFSGGYFRESHIIAPYIERFKAAYKTGDYIAEARNLSNQFDLIVASAEIYERDAVNIKLRDSLHPWTEALKRLALSAQDYLEAFVLLAEDAPMDDIKNVYLKGKAMFDSIEECTCPVLYSYNGTPVQEPVVVAPVVILPFMKYLRDEAVDSIELPLGMSTGITVKGFGEVYLEHGIENILDGDVNTFTWLAGRSVGAYIRIDLDSVIDITKLRVINGAAKCEHIAEGGDALSGYIDYSTDGVNYTKLCDLSGVDTILSLSEKQKISARFLRLVSTSATGYMALREVYVNSLGGHTGPIISYRDFGTPDTADGYPGSNNVYNVFDGNKETVACFNKSGRADGGYVTIDMMKTESVSAIRVLTGKPNGGDSFSGHIEISENGDDFVRVGDLTGADTVTALTDPVNARYIRIVMDTQPAGWAAIREVYVNDLGGLRPSVITYENFGAPSTADGYPGSNNVMNLFDGDKDTVACFNKDGRADGGFVKIDMLKAEEISLMRVIVGKPDGGDVFNGHVELSADGVSWTQAGALQGSDTVLEIATPVSARYIKIVMDTQPVGWAAIREVFVNDIGNLPAIVRNHNFGNLAEGTSVYNMLDGNDDTFAWFDKPHKDGDDLPYVELDYMEAKVMTTVGVKVGKWREEDGGGSFVDAFNGSVEWSLDGVEWHKLMDIDDYDNSITLIAANKVTARYLRIYSNVSGGWEAIREVSVT